MKIGLVMPTYFDADAVLAGGERYAFELARAISRKADATLFTFGDREQTVRRDTLTIQYCRTWARVGGFINPLAFSHLGKLSRMDVIHCLQPRTLVTDIAMALGLLLKKKTFLTDLGGGTVYSFSRFWPLHQSVDGFLPISEFNRGINPAIKAPAKVIYGGVDAGIFTPDTSVPKSKNMFLYVGRIFPLKGLHLLLEAAPTGARVEVIGQCSDASYITKLKALAQGKDVVFHGALSDAEVLKKLREAFVTVLPSRVDSGFTTAMESMACGTPVLGTRLGSLPEVVSEKTGFLVPPDNVSALRQKME
jgi:glycosyltransferase involved in cell wall biosynthesis